FCAFAGTKRRQSVKARGKRWLRMLNCLHDHTSHREQCRESSVKPKGRAMGEGGKATPRGRQACFQRDRKRLATASAAYSDVSSAIFCASMTSPATREPSGTKHQPIRKLPTSSSSCTFMAVP